MKKIITGCIIFIILAASVLPVCAAETMNFDNTYCFYNKGGSEWFRVLSSATNPAPDFGYTTDDLDVVIDFGTVFYSSDQQNIQNGFTYQLTMNINYNPNKLSPAEWVYTGTRLTNFGNMNLFYQAPLSSQYSISLDNNFKTSYSMIKNTDNTYTFTLIFHCNSDVIYNGFAPMFRGSATEGIYFNVIDFNIIRDINETAYNSLVLQQQTAIKNSIDSGFASVNNNFQVIEGVLYDMEGAINENITDNFNELEEVIQGDPADAEDNSSLKDDISDYEDAENEINDLIMAPIELPDGTSIQVDGSTLLNIKDFIIDTYKAPAYEADVGKQYNEIFELFMPYVGTCVFTSLLLGLGISFLKGRV